MRIWRAKNQEQREYYRDNVRCHLCGLPIPYVIVNPAHPLFGTVDHVKPVALGGTNARWNRRPSHRLCNLAKGCMAEVAPEVLEECRRQVKLEFRKHPAIIESPAVARAVKAPWKRTMRRMQA